jgi:trehalose synthase
MCLTHRLSSRVPSDALEPASSRPERVIVQFVVIATLQPSPLGEAISASRLSHLEQQGQSVRIALGGRRVVNVNSTAVGGGVAEMLHTLLGYASGVGIDVRWAVLDAPAEFYALTKRLHHMLHGVAGGLALSDDDRTLYEHVLKHEAAQLHAVVRSGDVVVLHDPQTAGLAPDLIARGVHVVWRCHIGTAEANATSERAWAFLRPYVSRVPVVVSRRTYLPDWMDAGLCTEIAPSIDPLSSKNVAMTPAFTDAVLSAVGLLGGGHAAREVTFQRQDGSPGRLEHVADIVQSGPPPPRGARLVVQISRWDPLKDMAGVMETFAKFVAAETDAHLVLAGPGVTAVTDDPEAAAVLRECMTAWSRLPAAVRMRVHLACLPMRDVEENGLMVNALQRAASVVVQKSLAEGFGLTVTEAMWKSRPVVATRVGGIPLQITHGQTGILIDDPKDYEAAGAAIRSLLVDPVRSQRIGDCAREAVRDHFLPDRQLGQWADLLLKLIT